MQTYLDFDLKITGQAGSYFAEVLQSPAGRSPRCSIDLPFAATDLPRILLQIENAVLRGNRKIRGFTGRDEKVLRDFGQGLFGAVFLNSEIQRKYESSLAKAGEAQPPKGGGASSSVGLRIRLQIEPPELAVLPWEYLYEKSKARYINMEVTTPIVRYLEFNQPEGQLQVEGPLRILGMISNPGGPEWATLDTERERRLIDEAMAPLEREGSVQFEWVLGGGWRHLLEKMRHASWHVFHFIGHGGVEEDEEEQGVSEGFVVMVEEDGSPRHVHTSKLKVALSGTRPLQLVVLNCCEGGKGSPEDPFTSPGAGLVQAGIPAVVAMQFPISEAAAIELASGFYRSLAEGWPIDAALTFSRKQMYFTSDVEWGIPILFTRASTGQLFRRDAGRSPVPFTEISIDRSDPGRRVTPTPTPSPLGRLRSDPDLRRARAPVADDPETAIQELNEAIDRIGATPKLLAHRAELYGRLRLFANAIADIDSAIAQAPGHARYHYLKGMLLTLAAGQDRQAANEEQTIDAFSRAIELEPRTASFFDARGTALGKAGRFDEALTDLTTAIDLEPRRAEYYRHRGVVYAKLGDLPSATSDLERSSELGDSLAHEELARRRFQAFFNRGDG